MPHYRPYPSAKEIPSRMTRKRLRKQIFEENHMAGNRLRAARKKEKRDAKGNSL